MKQAAAALSDTAALDALAAKFLSVREDGIALDLSKCPEAWDAAIRPLGRKTAYARLADFVCAAYREQTGRDFFFTQACVAGELGYHLDAYLRVRGFPGYPLHPTTLLLSKQAVEAHCKTVEIDRKDLDDFRQRLIFRYRKGLRKPQEANPPEEADPSEKSGLPKQ